MKVGFIGLGAMGSRIAKRLSLQQPSFNVFLHDINPSAITELLQETVSQNIKNTFSAHTLEEAVLDSNYVISCLPKSDHVLESIKHCSEGMHDCVWMDCTSGDAKTSQLISSTYFNDRKRNLYFMDTPISGGPEKAAKGTVAMMVGCDESNIKVFEQTKEDILQHIALNPIRVGNVGAGHALKCINNLLNVSNLLILSEGLRCVDGYGIDVETALQVINASSGRSLMSQERYPVHILEKDYFYDFQLGLMKKDVQNAVDLMKGLSSEKDDFVLANQVNSLMDIAVDRFGYTADYTEAGRLYLDVKRAELTNKKAK